MFGSDSAWTSRTRHGPGAIVVITGVSITALERARRRKLMD
ncbi:hypothetical protein [Natrinema sp. 74]